MSSCKHPDFIDLTKDLYFSSSVLLIFVVKQIVCLGCSLCSLTCLLSETHSLIRVALFHYETSVLLFLHVGWASSSATGSCYSSSKAGRLFTLSLCILNRDLFYVASLTIIMYPDLHVCFYRQITENESQIPFLKSVKTF